LFWRPVTAIQLAADDDNPATAPQADWMSFLPTPPYPDHPSGYNCFTAAMMYTARAFFRTDRITFQLTSAVTMTSRTYTRFTAVLTDTINARIYLGIHSRTPDVQGAGLGRRTANWVATHYFLRKHH
jgi:PAP2 superfamily